MTPGATMRNMRTGEQGEVTFVSSRYAVIGKHLVWREFWSEWEAVE